MCCISSVLLDIVCCEATFAPWFYVLLRTKRLETLVVVTCCRFDQLHRGNLTQRQRLELSRRTIALLLYLLRSPFFDKYTKHHLLRLLNTLSKHVPLMGLVLTPLAQYLPMWQDTYFYMWST
uniref:Peroxisomal membrane protein PEX16 n=1 Tax=Timema cristinae TaxID=61476 RepID=A0A7R9GPW5_TIMCR|nr:unnamed protein product [Timema cristinae]